MASIYGSLTVEFIPDGNETFVEHQGITETDIDLSAVATLGQATITPSVSGKVIVSFDGYCLSSQGDRIILAASNTQDWGTNDGAVSVEAVDSDLDRNSFSHTRVYDVNSGSHTFYAVAENYVETAGDGTASIYGSLTVEFIPDGNEYFVEHLGITETDIDLSSVATLGQATITPSVSGKVIVSFDGYCLSSQGDRIILAASDTQDWGTNHGAVSVEAVDSDVDRNSFSHTRVYDVNSGSHTFYAVAENYVETAGDGMASIY